MFFQLIGAWIPFRINFTNRPSGAIVDGKGRANDDHWREKPIGGVSGGIGGAIEVHDIDKCHERLEHPKRVLNLPALTISRPFDTTRKL